MDGKRLDCGAVDVKPVAFNFGEGYAERWEIIYPDVGEWDEKQCGAFLEDAGSDVNTSDIDDLRDMVREAMYEDSDRYSPMMNYLYPLPGLRMDDGAAQAAVEDTACVVVSVNLDGDWETFLALAGGGMDLSWDICAAYIALGYLPPVHFCCLPRYPESGKSDRDKAIIAACRRSCECAAKWAAKRIADLDAIGD